MCWPRLLVAALHPSRVLRVCFKFPRTCDDGLILLQFERNIESRETLRAQIFHRAEFVLV